MKPRLLSALLFLFAITGIAQAQSQEKIYSTLILNVAKGIQWPEGYADTELVIGVVEYGPLEDELKTIASAIRLGGKTIQVRHVSGTEDLSDCDVVFLPAFKAKTLPRYLTYAPTAPILFITNKTDLAKQGSGINFILVQGKMKYEINCKAIEARGMKISAAIKGMGIVVN
jgi:hypothetical protein